MLKPGLSRAIPMAIVGFLVGAALVIVIRLLQGLEPAWNVGVGIVSSSLFTAAFFVWGMGGFDPRMSVHGEEHEDETHEEEAPAKPFALLSNSLFQLTTLLIGFIVVIGFVAVIPFGPALTITEEPLASRAAVGFFELQAFGQTFVVSQLVVFIVFIIVMMLSLLIAAGALGWVTTSLSRGVANAQAASYTPLTRQPFELSAKVTPEPLAEEAVQEANKPLPEWLSTTLFYTVLTAVFLIAYQVVMPWVASPGALGGIVPFADDTILFFSIGIALTAAVVIARPPNFLTPFGVFLASAAFLYPIFYHVLIGLVYLAVLPAIGPITQEMHRQIVSIANALLIPLIVMRPKWVTIFIGRVARLLARFLRWVGTVK